MHPCPKPSLKARWVRCVISAAGVVFVGFLLYALSYGPALKVAGRKPGSGQVLPKWIFVVYGPLFAVKARLPQAVDGLYERYLDLWCPEPIQSHRHE